MFCVLACARAPKQPTSLHVLPSGLVWQPATRRCFASDKATRNDKTRPPVLIDGGVQEFEIPSGGRDRERERGGRTITTLRLVVGVGRQITYVLRVLQPLLLASFLSFSLHSLPPLAPGQSAPSAVHSATAMPKQQSGHCCRHRGNAKPCLRLGGDPLYRVQDLALPTCPPVKPPPRLVRCRAPCVSRLNLSMVQSRAAQHYECTDVVYVHNAQDRRGQ